MVWVVVIIFFCIILGCYFFCDVVVDFILGIFEVFFVYYVLDIFNGILEVIYCNINGVLVWFENEYS